jgi:hypothetical protein
MVVNRVLAQSDSIAQPQRLNRDMQQCPCSPYSVHFQIGHAMKVTRKCQLVQARARPDAHCLLPHPRRRKMKGSLICIVLHGPQTKAKPLFRNHQPTSPRLILGHKSLIRQMVSPHPLREKA